MKSEIQHNLGNLDVRVSHEFERLLKAAPPRPEKRHHLLKLLLAEQSPLDRRALESKILDFYRLSFERRTDRQMSLYFRVRPYPWLMQQFLLNFSTAAVNETEMNKVAGRFRHHFRFLVAPPEEITSIDFLHFVIYRITNPRWDQVNTGIDLPIFTDRWRSTSLFRFGARFEDFFLQFYNKLEQEFRTPFSLIEAKPQVEEQTSTTDLNLTQTELDWMKGILQALSLNAKLPTFPLSKGPSSPTTRRMEQLTRAAINIFPRRHSELDLTLRRACISCLNTFRQVPNEFLNESDEQCDTTIIAG